MSWLSHAAGVVTGEVKKLWPQVRVPAEAAAATYFGGPNAGALVVKANQTAEQISQQKQQYDQAMHLQQQEGRKAMQAYTAPAHSFAPPQLSGVLARSTQLAPSAGGMYSTPPPVQDAPGQPSYGPVFLLVLAAAGIYYVARGHHGH